MFQNYHEICANNEQHAKQAPKNTETCIPTTMTSFKKLLLKQHTIRDGVKGGVCFPSPNK